jgi:hypothetical protein
VGLSQVVYIETCQNRNFYFELLHEVSIFVFFLGVMGQSKWLMLTNTKEKLNLGGILLSN